MKKSASRRAPRSDDATGRRPLGPLATAVLVAAPVVAAALFYVWSQVTTVGLGYALSRAGEAHHALLEENRGLRVEVAALRAPSRLKKLAESRFSLGPPGADQVIHVGPEPLAARRE